MSEKKIKQVATNIQRMKRRLDDEGQED
jgi:hypothetical protein